MGLAPVFVMLVALALLSFVALVTLSMSAIQHRKGYYISARNYSDLGVECVWVLLVTMLGCIAQVLWTWGI